MTSKNLTRREDLELRQDGAWHVQVACRAKGEGNVPPSAGHARAAGETMDISLVQERGRNWRPVFGNHASQKLTSWKLK